MFCSDLISVFLSLLLVFLDFETRFYSFIVLYFLYKQYTGRSFFPDSTQKMLETRTGFCKPRHTLQKERDSEGGGK